MKKKRVFERTVYLWEKEMPKQLQRRKNIKPYRRKILELER